MKLKKTEKLENGAVYQKLMAQYEVTPDELAELNAALAVLARWKKKVRVDLKIKEKHADFTVYHFDPHKTNGVKVTVEQGANG